jgi:hypothetical protein
LLFVVATLATAGVAILFYIGLWLAIPLEQPGDELGPPTPRMRARARREDYGASTAAVTAIGSGAPFAG